MADWDIVRQAPAATDDWGVVSQEPVKRQIGAGEVASRAGTSILHSANAYAAVPAIGAAKIADAIAGLFGAQPGAADYLAEKFVVPSLAKSMQASDLGDHETVGPVGGAALKVAPELGKSVPDLAEGFGLASAAPKAVTAGTSIVQRLVDMFRQGTVAGVPAGQRRAVERNQELTDAGVDPAQAAGQAAVSGVLTNAQFALPASAGSAAATMPARIASRAGQGAALNTAAGASTRAVENAMLPAGAEALAQPVVSPEATGLDAVLGALFGQMGGRNHPGVRPTREQLGYKDLELAPVETPQPRPAAPVEYDPAAAAKAVQERLFATPDGSPTAPEMQLIPKGAEAPAGVAPAPDVSEVPLRVPPEHATEGVPRQAAREPGYDARGQEIPLNAEETFRAAEAQRARKQQGQDEAAMQGAERDLREARAGGTTTAEGTAATTPQRFVFFNAKIRDGHMVSGDRVEPQGEPFRMMGEDGKEIEAQKVRFVDREGQPELPVPTKLLSAKERPANPRYAQDIAATSYAPPRGVGTGEQQPKPREAAQRITTQPSPDFVPGDGSRRVDEQLPSRAPRRAAEDITDLAHHRVEIMGGDHAGTVRSDQVQLPTERHGPEGSGAPRGNGVQRPPAGGSNADGAELRAEGVARGADESAHGRDEAVAADEAGSLAQFEAHRDQTFKEAVKNDLRSLAKGAGWEERGGRLIRDAEGRAIDRTKWIAAEWYQGMRVQLGRKGLSERGQIMLAVEKYLEGDPLTANEQRTVGYMLDELSGLREQADFAGMKMDEAQAADVGLREAAAERTPQNLYDVNYLSRIQPEVVERLAMEHGDDTEGFMRAVAKEVGNEGHQGAARDAATARDSGGNGEGASRRPEATGAESARSDAGGLREENRAAEHQSGDEGKSRPEFGLDQPTEQQLRQRDSEHQRADEQQRRVEAAPPPEDFTLSGSDRPADEAAARGQKELFDGSGGDRGTLYANPFGKVLEWAVGDTKAWGNSLSELKNSIADLGREKPGHRENSVVAFVRAVFDSAAGDMRSVVKKAGNSQTATWVLDQLHNVAGSSKATGETMHDAVRAYVNKSIVGLHNLLGDRVNDRDALKQIAALVRNPDGIRAGTPIHDAADGIRKMLDEALKYMKDAGVELGEVKKGYFPREFDLDAVMKDPKGFMEATARAYRDNGMAPDVAMKAAKELHDGLLYGETSTLFKADRGATAAPFLKGRVFGKEVDAESHPLNKFLMSDPALALSKYFERAAKRAEIARRFGDNFAKWEDLSRKIIDEGGGSTLDKLRDFVALSAGIKKPGVSNGALRASSVMRTWGALMFLEKATLSSLSEFVVPAVRSGNVLDVGRSLKNTLADLFTKTKGAEERRAFAEDLGLISGHISSSLASARFAGGEPIGRLESQVLDRFFKRTGLNQWTDATRVAAADGARVFIRRLSKDMEGTGNLTKRFLAELGVPNEQAKDFAKYVLARGDGMPASGQLDGSMGDLYRVAVRKFSSQSIMDPSATSRPGWMSHPIGAIVGQLQAFNYAFYENVLKRNTKLAKEALTAADYSMAERAQLMAPMLMLPLVTAAAYAFGEARDAVFGDPNRRAEETAGEKALKAVSRGTPIAPLDPLVNYLSSVRYSRSAAEAFSGPVLGTFARVADAARDYFLKNSENTNTQERRAWKAVWDILVEPTINLALFASPVSPIAAAVTQAAGAGTVKEKLLVEPMAGEKKEKASATGRASGREAGRSSGRSAGRS